MNDGIAEFLGSDAKAAFDAPFSLNTVEELRRLASDAGLSKVHVRFEYRTLRYPVPEGLVVGLIGSTPVAGQFAALPDDRKEALVAYVVERLAGYVDDNGLAVPAENHFLTALKPT